MTRAESDKKLKVVATTSIIADWIKNIASDQVELTTLVGPDSDAHTFEPSASDSVALAHADVIFENGFGLEHWMNKLYTAANSKASRIVLAKSVVESPLTIFKSGDNRYEDVDPHVWGNIRYVVGMVNMINNTLKSMDPHHAKAYESRTMAYIVELKELDNWIMKKVAFIARPQRKIVTNHNSLGYFCERYQFEVVGAAFDSVTTEAEDSSAKKMAELLFKIKKANVKVIFAENIHNSKMIASLADEAHIKLAPALYTDALGPQGSQADTYIKMMKYNAQVIVNMLKDNGEMQS